MLLVHPDPLRLGAIARQLQSDFRTLTASSSEAALALMRELTVDVVVADSRVGVALLDEFEAREPLAPRVLLFGEPELDHVVEALGEEHVFVPLPDSAEASALNRKLKSLVRPRRDERLRPREEHSVRLHLPRGGLLSRPLLDVSSSGLAFLLQVSDDVDQLLPGTRLRQLSVWRGTEELLSGVQGTVRHLRPLRSKVPAVRGGYRVGVELVEEAPVEAEPDEKIHDRLRRLSLLRRAGRQAGLSIARVDDEGGVQLFQHAEADGRGALLVLAGEAPPDWEVGDVVRGTFDLGGRSYSFLTSIASLSTPGALCLRLPRGLRAAPRRRAARRHSIRTGEGFSVEVALPWQDEPLRRPLLDLSTAGFAFAADLRTHPLPVGTRLSEIRLRLPDGGTVVGRGRLRSRVRGAEAEPALARSGVAFEGLSLPDQVRIADAILHAGLPGIEDARGLTFRELWAFLQETGFLYPEKLERLRPVLPALEATVTTLLSTPSDLFKTLVFRNEQLLGHLSAVRLYSHTWMVQHLAARKEGAGRLGAARMLNLGITDYSEQLPQMEWLRVFFRPRNRWPARVFGRFARRVGDPSVCELRTLAYLTGESTGEPVREKGLEVRPARPEDARWIERHFLDQGRTLAVRAEELSTPEGLTLAELSLRYAKVGLVRRREVWVAERHGRPAGFALLELSSIGLNFSELTNTFTVHLIDPEPAVHAALVEAARVRYREAGRALCLALAPPADVPLFTARGFTQRQEYTSWTGHRSLYRRYYEYILRLFERTRVSR